MATTKVTSAGIADNATTLAKMAGGTDGNLITYDASGDPAYVTTGTSGQVLTSGGTGVAPTFQTAAGGATGMDDVSGVARATSGLLFNGDTAAANKLDDYEEGTFTSGAWRTRDLNTEISDADGIVSISSNQFTLATGTYTIEWEAPAAYSVNHHSTRLYNSTDASVEQLGSSEFANSSFSTISYGKDVVTISGSKTFEIQHFANLTSNTYGFGRKQYLDSSAVTILTLVKILKHS